MRTRCNLYGDEAARSDELGHKQIFTYSLVGADEKLIGDVDNAMHDLKRRVAPEWPVDEWSLHMKVLSSGQQRKKHRVFATWDRHKIEHVVDGLFDLVRSTHGLALFNISSVSASVTMERAKRDAYVALVLHVVDETTSQGAQPSLFFDSERSSKADRVHHEWASRLFVDSQHSGLYAFLAKGIEIPEPRFVRPGSHPCLELADFVSFVVARHHFDRWRGREPRYDLRRLGSVRYVGFIPTGLAYNTQEGFPWEMFYADRGPAASGTIPSAG
jgi:hypothetical protein